ncbi:MAG: hypothetical protein ACYC8T_18385 [Myxococcaceae bacterium]
MKLAPLVAVLVAVIPLGGRAAKPRPDAGVSAPAPATGPGGAPMSPVPHFQWDLPKVLSDIDIPGVQETNGVPVKLHVVVVKARLEDVMMHFEESFARQGLYVKPSKLPGMQGVPQVTGTDPETFIAYTVIFRPNGDGTVTLVLGETNTREIRPPGGEDFAPLFPGASAVVRTRAEGLRTISYTAPSTESDVQAFYVETLGKSGYLQRSPGVFRRGTDEIRLRVLSERGAVGVLVSLRTVPPDPEGP